MEKDTMRIMFICHGNICRSPMGEFIMKKMLKEAGLGDKVKVDSVAATRDEIGNDMYPPAKDKLRKEGVPFKPRQARLLTRKDYEENDYLIAMDQENLDDIRYLVGEDKDHKVHLMMDFAGEHREVADPWYTRNFDVTYDDLVKGCTGLLRDVREKLGE